MFKKIHYWNSLARQWLELCLFTAKGLGSIPGQGTKILQTSMNGRKNKKLIIKGPQSVACAGVWTLAW